jgi:DNA-directed RNA polymerase subunit D
MQKKRWKTWKKSIKVLLMNVKVINKEKDKISFILEGSSPALSNTIRRIMVAEVPVMAIEDVEIRKNSSALYDEIVAQRLGLIALTTDLKSYNLKSECKCKGEGCARCSLKLTLKVKGPKSVYASDLKTTDPKIKPVFPKTLIVKLLENQELEFEATAVLGKGKDHSKWSPGHVFFKLKPEIKIDNKKVKNPEAVIQACPKDIFELKNKKLKIKKNNLYNCHYCEACKDITEGITLKKQEEDYIFYLESWGQLSPKEMLIESTEIFKKKLDDFRTAL